MEPNTAFLSASQSKKNDQKHKLGYKQKSFEFPLQNRKGWRVKNFHWEVVPQGRVSFRKGTTAVTSAGRGEAG